MSNIKNQGPEHIVPREKLDFGLDAQTPRWWYGNRPFQTRVFDGMQAAFPDGERYFITSVRAFRHQITDPKLTEDVKNFIRQEGQHGIAHTHYNDLLRQQGCDVDTILTEAKALFDGYTRRYSAKYNLALTAAFEHFTAMMAQMLFATRDAMGPADPKVRAMWAWHAIEEMEHKAVAFDVMQKVAKVGYFRRVMALVLVTVGFNIHCLHTTNYMLKVDGFSRWQRTKIWAKGLWWLYKPGGIFMPMMGKYFSYLKPNFHPWQEPVVPSYEPWLRLLKETGNPVEAGNLLAARHLAGAQA